MEGIAFSWAFVWYEWVLVSTVPRAVFSRAFVWYEWLLVSTVPRALLVRPCIVWRSGSRSAPGVSGALCHLPIHANTLRRSHRETHGALATLVFLRTHACRGVQCWGGEVEDGGAEVRCRGGALDVVDAARGESRVTVRACGG